MSAPARLTVRVRPGASRTRVGGRYGGGDGTDGTLVVAVSARAVDGAATDAVLAALADALGVRPWQVVLVRGRTSRDKTVDIIDGPDDLDARLERLRDGTTG
jgi:uncharacterized protein YggU (UPF0235/DUF167 family)